MEELLVLVVEDDLTVQALIDEALCDGGYRTSLVASGEEALILLKGGQSVPVIWERYPNCLTPSDSMMWRPGVDHGQKHELGGVTFTREA